MSHIRSLSIYPKASTNRSSLGMNARAVAAFTRLIWYKALKPKQEENSAKHIQEGEEQLETFLKSYKRKKKKKILAFLWISMEVWHSRMKSFSLQHPWRGMLSNPHREKIWLRRQVMKIAQCKNPKMTWKHL